MPDEFVHTLVNVKQLYRGTEWLRKRLLVNCEFRIPGPIWKQFKKAKKAVESPIPYRRRYNNGGTGLSRSRSYPTCVAETDTVIRNSMTNLLRGQNVSAIQITVRKGIAEELSGLLKIGGSYEATRNKRKPTPSTSIATMKHPGKRIGSNKPLK